MTYNDPGHLRVCGERACLPVELLDAAMEFAPPGTVEPEDVLEELRCTLQAHSAGEHYAFVMEIDGADTGGVWAHWHRGSAPAEVVVLPDCPLGGPLPAGEPCCEFAGHPGGHTWQQQSDRRHMPVRFGEAWI